MQDLVGRLMTDYKWSRLNETSATIEFLTGRAEDAAKEWEQATKAEHAGGLAVARLHLDIPNGERSLQFRQ